MSDPSVDSSVSTPPKGLLRLSPELILEIASHILSDDELRSARIDSSFVFGRHIYDPPLIPSQTDLGNFRLVCRHLDAILQREAFKSLVFNLHITRWASAADVESRLALLAQGGSPASAHVRFLLIKCIDHTREGYGYERPRRQWFYAQNLKTNEKYQALAKSIGNSTDCYLERAILSLQNLRCVTWTIEVVDTLSVRVMHALSSLPSLEDLTLHIGGKCEKVHTLDIGKFHDLRSFVVTLSYLRDNQRGEIVDHISTVISRSPLLNHLSVLQSQDFEAYNISLESLTKKVPRNRPLDNLKSLHIKMQDLPRHDSISLHHLKALKSLRIEGSTVTPFCDGTRFWQALADAKIELQEITVSYLSESLLNYLATYSGLKKLQILLYYLPIENEDSDPESDDEELEASSEKSSCSTRDDLAKHFLKNIVPLHSLRLKVPLVDANIDDDEWESKYPLDEGLFFESVAGKANQEKMPITLTSWTFHICEDSSPWGLSFMLDCATQEPIRRTEKIRFDLTPTLIAFRCGTGRQGHSQRQWQAAIKWLTDLEVLPQDLSRYPNSISLGCTYHLKKSDGKQGVYVYVESDDDKP